MLVVVEDRDVELLAQPALDLEATRSRDVLEVDSTEDGRDGDDRADDLVHILGGQADRPGVDVRELLEQHRLALHDRKRRLGADVAEAEDSRTVGHHRDGVLFHGQPPDLRGIVGDRAETRATPGV